MHDKRCYVRVSGNDTPSAGDSAHPGRSVIASVENVDTSGAGNVDYSTFRKLRAFLFGTLRQVRIGHTFSCAEHGAGVGSKQHRKAVRGGSQGPKRKVSWVVDETATARRISCFVSITARDPALTSDYDRRDAPSAPAEHRPGRDRLHLGDRASGSTSTRAAGRRRRAVRHDRRFRASRSRHLASRSLRGDGVPAPAPRCVRHQPRSAPAGLRAGEREHELARELGPRASRAPLEGRLAIEAVDWRSARAGGRGAFWSAAVEGGAHPGPVSGPSTPPASLPGGSDRRAAESGHVRTVAGSRSRVGPGVVRAAGLALPRGAVGRSSARRRSRSAGGTTARRRRRSEGPSAPGRKCRT